MAKFEKPKDYYLGQRSEMFHLVPKDCKKILEVGCGEGNFLLPFASNGVEVWGIEPMQLPAEKAKLVLHKVFNAILEDVLQQLPDQYFDAIIFNDVLEHMLQPGDNLKSLLPKLSQNGKIITSIPNFRYAKNVSHVFLSKKFEYAQSGILDDTHFRFFTKKSIYTLFENNGYQIQKIEGINPTNKVKHHLLIGLLSLFTLSSHADMRYLQFGVVATKTNP
jgi:2-polyprenyl-3-methyl-5-hydroxy-6-metoxy-1,4-benzoquinol methylase